MIVDSFAGGGGASTGIEMALGRSPDIAINHNPAALALHKANHPDTLHLSENVWQVDPLDYVKGRHVGLAWFSPDCKHFSKAKGGKPVERNIRDLAWVVVLWAERVRPDVILLENVEEFRDWGPLREEKRNGKVVLLPDPDRRGATFAKWAKQLRRLGYKLEHRELRACDYGAPTIRRRLFLVARCDGRPIVWPEPTHGRPDDPDVIAGRKLPWRTAAEVIDWSLPCPSIFDTAAEIMEKHGLRAVRPLADATMCRVARGVKRYVLDAAKPFLVVCNHQGDHFRGQDVDDPMNTVTAARDAVGVLVPSVVKFQTGSTGHAADEPLHTVTANSFKKKPGGAAPLGVATAFLAQHNNDSRRDGGVNPGRPADEPLSTITANPQQGVISVFVSRQFGTSTGHAMDEPTYTATAAGNKSALVTPHLMTMRNAGKPFNGADEPTHTVTAGGAGLTVVAPFMQKYYGTGDGARVDDPCHSVTTKDRFGFVETVIDLPPFTPDQKDRAREVADFLRAHGFWDEREFVTLEIGGITCVMVDIGMRMLTPRELFNAQGFPPDYVIDLEFNGKPLPKDAQISCCGNSVCPPLAAALVAANCGHLARWREAAE